jgi:hypothetical protein
MTDVQNIDGGKSLKDSRCDGMGGGMETSDEARASSASPLLYDKVCVVCVCLFVCVCVCVSSSLNPFLSPSPLSLLMYD